MSHSLDLTVCMSISGLLRNKVAWSRTLCFIVNNLKSVLLNIFKRKYAKKTGIFFSKKCQSEGLSNSARKRKMCITVLPLERGKKVWNSLVCDQGLSKCLKFKKIVSALGSFIKWWHLMFYKPELVFSF